MYWRYVICSDPQLEQPERFIETLVATGGRALVVTAPRSCHLQHHHWSKCPFCRNKPGVNRAGAALMKVRKDLLG
jgi:predicted NAD-dependent protein-ADP-ribosyltransferase YbiA (DUF1768 family)